jgi:hypothetical protein
LGLLEKARLVILSVVRAEATSRAKRKHLPGAHPTLIAGLLTSMKNPVSSLEDDSVSRKAILTEAG